MTVRQQWAVVLGIVALLAGGAFAASHLLRDELRQVTVGSKAPGFAAVTVDGTHRVRTLSDYRGDVLLLNVWATWCGPCRQEMPSMQALHEALGPRGLRIVAVSVDEAGMEPAINKFAKEFGLTFEILHDTTFAIETVYRTSGVPETMVIARDGTIRKKWVGANDWNSEGNRKLIEQLLAEPR